MQSYHKGFGFEQQIQEKWTSQLQVPKFTSWTKLGLCAKIIPLLIPRSRYFFDKLVVSELVKKFPTISGTTNYAYPQNVILPLILQSQVSLEKPYSFFSRHIVFWFLFPQKEGAGGLYILIFLCLCFFFSYSNRSDTHDFLIYCIFLYFIFNVKFLWVWIRGIYSHSLLNSLEINFNTTHSNQCHSQGTSSLHVLRGFCEFVLLITHITCAVRFILDFIVLILF